MTDKAFSIYEDPTPPEVRAFISHIFHCEICKKATDDNQCCPEGLRLGKLCPPPESWQVPGQRYGWSCLDTGYIYAPFNPEDHNSQRSSGDGSPRARRLRPPS